MQTKLTRQEIKSEILNNQNITLSELTKILRLRDKTIKHQDVSGSHNSLLADGLVAKIGLGERKKVLDILIVEKSKSKANRPYDSSGEGKALARHLIIKAIDKSVKSTKKILNLSGSDCAFELEMAKEHSSVRFVTAENSKDNYFKMLQTIATNRLPIDNVYQGELIDLIKTSNESEFSHVNLDFCGQLSTTAETIKLAMTKKIVEVGGILTVTIAKRISNNSHTLNNHLRLINPKSDTDLTNDCEHDISTFLTICGGFSYFREKVYSYKDTSSMVLIIMRRIS